MPPLPSVKQFNVLADAAGLIKARDHHYAHRSHEDGCDNQAEDDAILPFAINRSEEHTSELQSLMRISYAVFCLKKKTVRINNTILQCRHNKHTLDITTSSETQNTTP